MRATAPNLRRRNFARAEATRAWVEATKRQALDTSDDSLSDANSLNSLSDNSLNSLSDDNSLDSDSDAGRQPPPQTTNPPQLTGAAKTRQRLTAGSRGRVTRRSLEQRQVINTSDDNSVDSLDNSLASADSSADEARPLPTSTRRPNLSSKTRARLAAKHRRALDARQALDSDSADSVNDSLDSGAESSADEARPLRRPTRTQKTRARRAIDARQALDSSADDNSLDSLSDNSLNSQNSLDSGLSDGNSLDSNSLDSASDSDAARPLPTNPPNITSKAPKRLGAGSRLNRREILGTHHDLVASAEAAAEAEVPTIAPRDLTNAPAKSAESEEEEEEYDAYSVSSVSSDEEDEKDEKKEKETGTGTANPTATATDGAAATTVGGTATATITSGPPTTSEPADALAPVNSDDATALPTLTLAPEHSTASPSSVLGAIDGQPQADTQGQQTLVPVPKKMSAGATAGIVLGVLGFIALCTGFFFLFMKWRARRRPSSVFGTRLADDEKGGDNRDMPGGNVPPVRITFTRPSWPIQEPNQNQGGQNDTFQAQAQRYSKTNSEMINDLMRAAYATENGGAGGNNMAAAYGHADHYIDEKAYAMLAGQPPTPSVAGTEKRGVSKWLADVMTPRQSSISQRWPYPVDPPESLPSPVAQGRGMSGYGNNGTTTSTKQKRLTPPRLPLKPVMPASLRPGGGAGPVGGVGLPPGSNVNPRMTVVSQTTNTTSSTARWG
ncbi:hypothetical protein B0H65DRAFT_281374 [Neurospora tetraspora]|uniref:Uncharacterized protein n=1 Tax=Neurospora tetraspora TaxID=94610 RepID=A0AAE0J8Q1_9PEZI|nr:hypothetical protein B0H65DRAFT_281374 [Neurospora tetraspora]